MKNLRQGEEVRALPADQQYHKKFWDHEPGQLNLKTTGWFAEHVDNQMGVSFDDLEGLSVRQQRQIIKKRAAELNKVKQIKFKYHNRGQGMIMLQERLSRQEQMLKDPDAVLSMNQSFFSHPIQGQGMLPDAGPPRQSTFQWPNSIQHRNLSFMQNQEDDAKQSQEGLGGSQHIIASNAMNQPHGGQRHAKYNSINNFEERKSTDAGAEEGTGRSNTIDNM